ncbi:MAG: hypothetical protein H7A48_08255 [Akkermansiaceae bacterium]|nr:hypothetical protein [Akkermansiaceae bacterium]
MKLPVRIPHPEFPVGTIHAYPTLVQTGIKPTLQWSVVLPDGETEADYAFFVREVSFPIASRV